VSVNLSLLWRILIWGWLASEIVIGIATRTKRSSGNVRDRGTLAILWIVIFASITACEWIGDRSTPNMFGGAHWLKPLSDALIMVGLAVRWTAILTLGKAFSSNVAIQQSQTIQRSGLYRIVRHPSYLGMLIIFFAIGVHSRNWLGLAVVMIPTTVALLYRIHVEEIALRDAFGAEYADYSKFTKRLIPGIY
jgi:protein-S-isoprenylcysteine O-methyltransferase Ste14